MKICIILLTLVGLSSPFLFEICEPEAFCFLPGQCCACGGWDKCNIYILIGDTLDMTCILTQTKLDEGRTSSELSIIYGSGKNITNEATIVDTASLHLEKLITGPGDKGTYSCILKDSGVVQHSLVEVEYPPQSIENFTCTIYNFDEGMVCTWDLGTYLNENLLNVNLEMEGGFCPDQEKNKCTWKSTHSPMFDRTQLKFSITVTNTRTKDSKTTEVTLDQQDYVKPNPVDQLEAYPINGTCVQLHWLHSKADRDLYFEVYWNDNKTETRGLNSTVCDLKPVKEYNFTVYAWPGKDQGFPSFPVQNSTETGKDVPSRPPEFESNSYRVNEDGCRGGQKRQVTVHWKQLPPDYHNGQMYGYQLLFRGDNTQKIIINNTDQLQQTTHVPCDSEVKVTLRSWNEMGYSVKSSMIVIPKAKYLTSAELAGIVVGGLLVVILLLLINYYLFRKKCCKHVKHAFDLPEITMPKIDKYKAVENGSVKSSNNDSGHGTTSSTTSSLSAKEDSKHLRDYSGCYENSICEGTKSATDSVQKAPSVNHSDVELEVFDEEDGKTSSNSFHRNSQLNSCVSYESTTSDVMLLDSGEDEDGYLGTARSSSDEEDDEIHSYVKKDVSSSCSDDSSSSQKSSCQSSKVTQNHIEQQLPSKSQDQSKSGHDTDMSEKHKQFEKHSKKTAMESHIQNS